MRKAQSGVFLISAAIAVAVVSLLISFWGLNYSRQLRIEKAERIGEALKVMGDKVQSFVVEHHDKIDALLRDPRKTFVVEGVRFERGTDAQSRPYLTNLSAITLLKATRATGIGDRPPGNVGAYGIHVYHECKPGTSVCNVDTLTYIDKPMARRYSSEPDMDAAGMVARKIGVLGGVSLVEGQHDFRFIGTDGEFGTVANPKKVAGLVAMRGGYSTVAHDVLVRRDGSQYMTGPLNFEQPDGTNPSKKHDIVGVGTVTASAVEASKLTVTGGDISTTGRMQANGATISGELNLSSDVSNPNTYNDIVGAKDIKGSGQLHMQGMTIAGDAKVGKLNSTGGATLGGPLDMSDKDIKKAGRVEADTLRAEEGVVELQKGSVQGQECKVWGMARDGDGRLLSCQRNAPGSNYWVWKLASTPGSVKEVPVEIVKEIIRDVKVDEQWKVSRFSLVPTWEGARHRDALYFYVASQRNAKVLACTITNTRSSGAMMRAAKNQGDYIVTQSADGTEELMCLSKGTGVPTVRENAWYWWGWPGFDEHGGYRRSEMGADPKVGDRWFSGDTDGNTMPEIHHAIRRPTRVVNDTQPAFNKEMQDLFRTFGMSPQRVNMNGAVLMATVSGESYSLGSSWTIVNDYEATNPVFCKFNSSRSDSSVNYAISNSGRDYIWLYVGRGYPTTYTVQCSFSSATSLARGHRNFRLCLKDCPFK
ncbi:hypothetical protein LXM60_14935 [Pandoraea sputorum]|uniref:shufflon system plasmid conjugative transfer pilus tip adhesin PilV n=1 Tax=Pandoraea sputorum TaxID=93222 RepID=UPI001E2A3E02|nr:shufflon system plasmid conjugative transfer pilus tip adhesin PilV [Pandoraea sputorum]MCE4061499.1 hypothetical protein [Pandoraea sputorum]